MKKDGKNINRIQYGLEILNEVKEVNKTDYRRIIINEKQFYKMMDK